MKCILFTFFVLLPTGGHPSCHHGFMVIQEHMPSIQQRSLIIMIIMESVMLLMFTNSFICFQYMERYTATKKKFN